MNKILVHMNISESGEYDIFNNTDPVKWQKDINEKNNNSCPNIGNKLWFQAIISEIESENNSLTFWNNSISTEEINSDYDILLAPMANIFSTDYIALLNRLADHFEKIKIPVFVIACGVQADTYDELNSLCEKLKDPASKFIKAVYNTGGEFALRGYFTKEFFNKLGFSSAVVTGCPSLYQLGKNLPERIQDEKVSNDKLKPVFNGTMKYYTDYMKEYRNSQFIDQNVYYDVINNENYFSSDIKAELKKLCKIYGYDQVNLILNDRVKLFPDMLCWMNFLKSEQFNFSYGERIHGNIMPILSGIPALVKCCDSRTKEMADFFNIPYIDINEKNDKHNKHLYEFYMNMDYSKFKSTFAEKFDNFEKFLKKCGLVEKINPNNKFLSGTYLNIIKGNSDRLCLLKNEFERNKVLYSTYDRGLKYYRAIMRKNKG